MAEELLVNDGVRADFASWIRSDWILGTDSTRFSSFMRFPIAIYQVISCLDVRVSRYRQLGNEEDLGEDENESSSYLSNTMTTRMLRLVLNDGQREIIAYEYEPIACLDVFHANLLTGNPIRCCGKIGIFNDPVERRGALWLTRSNVKLIFEGYKCKSGKNIQPDDDPIEVSSFVHEHFSPSTFPASDAGYSSVAPVSQDFSGNIQTSSIDEITLSQSLDDVISGILQPSDHRSDCGSDRAFTAADDYFPKGSPNLHYSYDAFLLRSRLNASESSYVEYFSNFLRSNGFFDCTSIVQQLSQLNKLPALVEPSPKWLEDDSHFGFLDFSIPLGILDMHSRSDVIADELRNAGFSDSSRVWLVNLNDCCYCFYCLVSLETLDIVQTSLLETSRAINSKEGFFDVKCFGNDGVYLYWIYRYRVKLDPAEFAKKAALVDAEYAKIQAILDF
ncbi:uncharacterized protein BBOV_IV006770 [Babesia bovis T2Bo]|uniref:RecQ mediated genome instability protein 1 OB-fold domain-containing protein n=1 Tax=Babesia bovis TaxID=5865 RepID=A7AR64_BABBO|nr:uncharacterized protein BBOV_IV006770 [Babesia bovis T2Bo]EDO07033.1 hypothetical protein BBOV_IV006770 [Babesia bovis T2Bo]|eukprot:XP_001610601.1 hypothetical protein [Babesia bovis T2Bo]